jgi:non-specific serine/threonine protein kinase
MLEGPRIGAEFAGYRVEALVARGGMAAVYRAHHLRLDRTVALKIIALELAQDDRFRERFLRESRVAAGIDHQNIVPVYDAGEAEGLLYIAMRYVDDTDLRDLLRADAPLEVDRAIAIASQAASALAAAHRRDLVHRDVKPGNILLIRRSSPEALDHVYLSDFGLAKHSSSVSGLTKTGQFVGTVSYTAPEQVEGKPVDARTDVYALGCVLFECLTGRPPFKKEEDVAVIMAHLREEAPLVTDLRADCPPPLARVVAKALAKPPEERFQSCDEMVVALRAAGSGRPVPAGAAEAAALDQTEAAGPPIAPPRPAPVLPDSAQPPAEPPGPPRRRRWPLLAAGFALVAALVVGLVAVLGGGDAKKKERRAGPVAAVTPSGPRWTALGAAPTARQQVATAVDGGRIWVIGGLAGATATRKVERYDPATGSWTAEPDLPLALHHAMAATYRGEPVVAGGWVPSGANLSATASKRVFALRGGHWVALPPLRHARAAGAAAVAGGKLVVVGGQANGKLVSQTEVFDGRRWREAEPMPTLREHLAAASDGRSLYAVGGRNLSADRNTGALESYEPDKDRWTKLPSMPVPAGSLGAAVVRGHVVAVGGEGPNRVLGAVQSFDVKSMKWSRLPAMRTPRHGTAVGAVGGTLYALDGGRAPAHAGSTSVAEGLDLAAAFGEAPSVRAWRAVRSAGTARQQLASAVVGGRLWVAGGLTRNRATTEVEAYDPAIDTWTPEPPLPLALHHAAAAAYRGEVVVVGGWTPHGANLSATASNQVFALHGGEWVALPAMRHGRAAGAAAVAGGKLVVVGGQAGGRLVPQTEVFDGRAWRDAAPMPTPREHLAAASDGRYLYAVGGRDLSADRNTGALERYDPATDRWTKLAPMPKPAGSLGAAIVRGHLVAVGGEGPDSVLGAVQSFDLRAGAWSELPDMRTPRHGTAVAAFGDTLFAVGGARSPGHAGSTDVAEALEFR